MSRRDDGAVALRTAALALAGAAIAVGIALASEAPRRPGAPQTYVIPPGTGARVRAGEPVDDVLPQTIATGVGVALVVENHDVEDHAFGPFELAPGQSWRRQFASPGTYAFTCSIYPAAGFAIDVAPAERQGAADAIRRAWLTAWAIAGAALAAAVAWRLVVDAGADGAGRSAAPPRLAGGWAGAALGLAPVGWAAATRVADWGPVLSGRTSLALLAAAVIAIAAVAGAVAGGRRAKGHPAAPGLALLAAIGAGVLVAAARASRGSDRPAAGRLALAGAVLLVGSVPAPAGATPPVAALVAVPALVAATGVAGIAWLGGDRFGLGADRGGLVRAAACAVVLAQLSALWGALVTHVDAMALPLEGNPVPASERSVARGAAIWAAECAACHASAADVARDAAGNGDVELLELLTRGRGEMPGFAYRLDLGARGDVLNFLRAAPAEQPLGGDAPSPSR